MNNNDILKLRHIDQLLSLATPNQEGADHE